MDFEKSQEQPRVTAQELRDRLLRGEMEPEDFLDQLLEIDQSTLTHEAAAENTRVLEDERVKDLLVEKKLPFGYDNLLSLSAFHEGQIKAMNADDPTQAFGKSLAAAERTGDADWIAYARATLAYFQKDTVGLEAALEALPEGTNKHILGNMLAGLKSRGDIDYRADYKP